MILMFKFYETNISLIPEPDRDTTERELEAYVTVNTDAKILNKIPAKIIKRLVRHILTWTM